MVVAQACADPEEHQGVDVTLFGAEPPCNSNHCSPEEFKHASVGTTHGQNGGWGGAETFAWVDMEREEGGVVDASLVLDSEPPYSPDQCTLEELDHVSDSTPTIQNGGRGCTETIAAQARMEDEDNEAVGVLGVIAAQACMDHYDYGEDVAYDAASVAHSESSRGSRSSVESGDANFVGGRGTVAAPAREDDDSELSVQAGGNDTDAEASADSSASEDSYSNLDFHPESSAASAEGSENDDDHNYDLDHYQDHDHSHSYSRGRDRDHASAGSLSRSAVSQHGDGGDSRTWSESSRSMDSCS